MSRNNGYRTRSSLGYLYHQKYFKLSKIFFSIIKTHWYRVIKAKQMRIVLKNEFCRKLRIAYWCNNVLYCLKTANGDISNANNFKFLKYKAKLLGNSEADGANGILKNATITVSLKYLSNFWRLLGMTLINGKIET